MRITDENSSMGDLNDDQYPQLRCKYLKIEHWEFNNKQTKLMEDNELGDLPQHFVQLHLPSNLQKGPIPKKKAHVSTYQKNRPKLRENGRCDIDLSNFTWKELSRECTASNIATSRGTMFIGLDYDDLQSANTPALIRPYITADNEAKENSSKRMYEKFIQTLKNNIQPNMININPFRKLAPIRESNFSGERVLIHSPACSRNENILSEYTNYGWFLTFTCSSVYTDSASYEKLMDVSTKQEISLPVKWIIRNISIYLRNQGGIFLS